MNTDEENRKVLESRPFFDQTFTNVEGALGILTTATALRSEWIDRELSEPVPNEEKIKLWRKEQENFNTLTHDVYAQNESMFEYVLNVLADENEIFLRNTKHDLPDGTWLEIASDN